MPEQIRQQYQLLTIPRPTPALLSLLAFWALVPVVVFVPPHPPWALAAFILGIYLPGRTGQGGLRGAEAGGACQRCGNALTVKPSTKISLPYKVICYNCHFHPYLDLAQVPE